MESDIRGFFDEVSHKWMLKFLKHRIGDARIIRLISRMLKGGIMEDGLVKASEKGTPQGSILSPLCNEDFVQVAQSQKPAKNVHLGRLFAGIEMDRVA